MPRTASILLLASALVAGQPAFAAKRPPAETKPKKEDAGRLKSETFAGLELRSIGPAVTSGRIGDIAIDPSERNTWYLAVASGGVWKTTTAGTSWTPIFDGQSSYSIGCVTLDPRNPLVVWVGTGENNSQRSVGYGDGVYKSLDGGKNWEKKGLEASEHIGKIVVDPRDSAVVYVAAQGPLWSPGGDRGLYKTTDGGTTWKQVLKISENTGVSDLVLDPRNPDVLYAAAYQRRRHVWTLIDGGPESAIYKSTDAGATWRKLENGIPKVDKGRIGLALAPADPDVVYAIIEAAGKEGGFFRSRDAGGNWEKRGDHVSGSPQYYQELVPDPKNVDRVYSMDTWLMVTDDGGKTFRRAGERFKHVDNHALWIDPDDSDHLINGCDGGVYESFDRAATWRFFSNLPVTQFYRVAVDDAQPFYNVYGGTQDNFTLGGPSRTRSTHGIVNADWFVTVGGDGFEPAVDPSNPDIVYSQSQYGGLVRFDRRTGQRIDIQPQPADGDDPPRWNWDSPLLVSPHSPSRIYFAAQRIYRSDDRGDTWRPISPDLTRKLDRNALEVMGRIWSVDAVAKNASTSFYGNLVALAESPRRSGLLYAGTDDGLVQVTEDGGGAWRKIEKFTGIPDRTYVSDLDASAHDDDTVYAAFDNHKQGDFKPYLLRSVDRGRSFTSIVGDLPVRGSVYSFVEDPADRTLWFAGTEFGVFFTRDAGKRWVKLTGGMPPVAVRDLAIQARADDLVVATFGRGFYILDDLAPLRAASEAWLERESVLLPVENAWMYVPMDPLGIREKSFQGESFFAAPNPPFGAVFTYYLKDEIKSRKKLREEREKKTAEAKEAIAFPAWEDLRAEDREEDPAILITVTDADGSVVRRITGPVTAGFHRVAWDLRYPASNPTSLTPPEPDPFSDPPAGPLAAPGAYSVSIAKRVDGKTTALSAALPFRAEVLGTAALPPTDRETLLDFQKKTARLQRAVLGAAATVEASTQRIRHLRKAFDDTPAADPAWADEIRALDVRLQDLGVALSGDPVRASRNEPTSPSIVDRVQGIVGGHWSSTSAPTTTHRQAYDVAARAFADVLAQLRTLVESDLVRLEERMEERGAPLDTGTGPTLDTGIARPVRYFAPVSVALPGSAGTRRFMNRSSHLTRLAHAAVALALVAGLADCGGDKPGPDSSPAGTPAGGPGDTILVGHYGSMTGSEATFGQSTDKGIQLAVQEINAAGGVKGKKVIVKTYDDQGKSQEAGTAVTRFITDDKVTALLGAVASSLSIAGGRVAQQYGVPMISPSSTNPAVTQIGDMIFRVCFLDPFQGWVEAKFAYEDLKARKAAILYDQAQAYSKGLSQYFREAFEQMGGTITTEQAFTGGDQDFSAQLTTIRETNPDVIFVPGYYTDAGNVAIQVRKLNLTAPMLGGDGWDSTQLAAIGGDAIEGSYFSNHYSFQENRPEVQNFVSKFEASYGEKPDGLAALGYDAARLLFDAMNRATALDGKTLAAAIAATKDFPGVTGKITIDAERNARKSAVVVQMKGGIPVYVRTIEPQ